jgi:hypothetical protein
VPAADADENSRLQSSAVELFPEDLTPTRAWRAALAGSNGLSLVTINHALSFSPGHKQESRSVRIHALEPLPLSAACDAFSQMRVELWTTDEHRIGLKPLLRHVWAPIGQRPTAVIQHQYTWRYPVGFVHPASGRTLLHLATAVSTPHFQAELAAFADQAGAILPKQIVLVLDRAGWRASQRLRVPNHALLLFLPLYSILPSSSQPSTCGRSPMCRSSTATSRALILLLCTEIREAGQQASIFITAL